MGLYDLKSLEPKVPDTRISPQMVAIFIWGLIRDTTVQHCKDLIKLYVTLEKYFESVFNLQFTVLKNFGKL